MSIRQSENRIQFNITRAVMIAGLMLFVMPQTAFADSSWISINNSDKEFQETTINGWKGYMSSKKTAIETAEEAK